MQKSKKRKTEKKLNKRLKLKKRFFTKIEKLIND